MTSETIRGTEHEETPNGTRGVGTGDTATNILYAGARIISAIAGADPACAERAAGCIAYIKGAEEGAHIQEELDEADRT